MFGELGPGSAPCPATCRVRRRAWPMRDRLRQGRWGRGRLAAPSRRLPSAARGGCGRGRPGSGGVLEGVGRGAGSRPARWTSGPGRPRGGGSAGPAPGVRSPRRARASGWTGRSDGGSGEGRGRRRGRRRAAGLPRRAVLRAAAAAPPRGFGPNRGRRLCARLPGRSGACPGSNRAGAPRRPAAAPPAAATRDEARGGGAAPDPVVVVAGAGRRGVRADRGGGRGARQGPLRCQG